MEMGWTIMCHNYHDHRNITGIQYTATLVFIISFFIAHYFTKIMKSNTYYRGERICTE